MERESKIKKLQSQGLKYYLWFIGVDPNEQNKGIGTGLLNGVIKEAISKERPIYLETSTVKNIPWYENLDLKFIMNLILAIDYFL